MQKVIASITAIAVATVFGLSNYDFSDNVAPSANPPGGLSPTQVPQFVVIGFDDNSYSGDIADNEGNVKEGEEGMRWLRNFYGSLTNPQGTGNAATFDGTPARTSFYMTTYYSSGANGDSPALVRKITNQLYKDGHEIGNHTQSHSESLKGNNSESVWDSEIKTCNEWLTKPLSPKQLPLYEQDQSTLYGSAIPVKDIVGFRTPFLAYGGVVFPTLKANNIAYDCTIEEGGQYEQDGTNYLWPYTLDAGSPGHDVQKDWGNGKDFAITNTPGLWELPNHMVIIPPDDKCADYGVDHSIIDKMKANMKWFSPEGPAKFTGFDWNFWAQAKLNKAESIAILKYTLDLRLQGNRAPFMWGAHSGNFTKHKDSAYPTLTTRERQEVVEEFIKYALTKSEVRVVPGSAIIDWCRNPVALNDIHYKISSSVLIDTVEITDGCTETEWSAEKRYDKPDMVVCYNGHNWSSIGWNYENMGVTPNSKPEYWKDLGPCGGYQYVKGGKISIEGVTVAQKGASVTYTFTPDAGYDVVKLFVNGKEVPASNSYTINSIDKNYTIDVSFTDGNQVNLQKSSVKNKAVECQLSSLTTKEMMISVPKSGTYTVSLYSVSGRLLYSGASWLTTGHNQIDWNGNTVSSAIVLVQIKGDEISSLHRAIIK